MPRRKAPQTTPLAMVGRPLAQLRREIERLDADTARVWEKPGCCAEDRRRRTREQLLGRCASGSFRSRPRMEIVDLTGAHDPAQCLCNIILSDAVLGQQRL